MKSSKILELKQLKHVLNERAIHIIYMIYNSYTRIGGDNLMAERLPVLTTLPSSSYMSSMASLRCDSSSNKIFSTVPSSVYISFPFTPSSLTCRRPTLLSHIFLHQVRSVFFSISLSLSHILNLLLFVFPETQKRSAVRVSSGSVSSVGAPKCFASGPDQLRSAREDIKELLRTTFCHPIMVCLRICQLNELISHCFKI